MPSYRQSPYVNGDVRCLKVSKGFPGVVWLVERQVHWRFSSGPREFPLGQLSNSISMQIQYSPSLPPDISEVCESIRNLLIFPAHNQVSGQSPFISPPFARSASSTHVIRRPSWISTKICFPSRGSDNLLERTIFEKKIAGKTSRVVIFLGKSRSLGKWIDSD